MRSSKHIPFTHDCRVLKRATKFPSTGEGDTRAVVQRMLAGRDAGGEARVREYARELDNWDGNIVVICIKSGNRLLRGGIHLLP